jgi:Ferritin-like domain
VSGEATVSGGAREGPTLSGEAAVPGSAHERPESRRAALARGAALALGGALALARPATAQTSDVDHLERLLALEQRLESLYEAALERDAIEPGLGETLLEHEREHVRGLEMALRARGRRSPRATVPLPQVGTAFASRPAFAGFAADLEAETVGSYEEVLPILRSTRLLLPLGSIMASGAQHVVALRQAAGDDLLAPA